MQQTGRRRWSASLRSELSLEPGPLLTTSPSVTTPVALLLSGCYHAQADKTTSGLTVERWSIDCLTLLWSWACPAAVCFFNLREGKATFLKTKNMPTRKSRRNDHMTRASQSQPCVFPLLPHQNQITLNV